MKFMKRWFLFLICGMLLANCCLAVGEEHSGSYTNEVYSEPEPEDFQNDAPALYTASLLVNGRVYQEKDLSSRIIFMASGDDRTIEILSVGLEWLVVRTKGEVGCVRREAIDEGSITALDSNNTSALNVQKNGYVAVTAKECHIRKTMDPQLSSEDDGNNWAILNPGTWISILQLYKGWAMVTYMRTYGYILPSELADLRLVAPEDDPITSFMPVAAYTTYYSTNKSDYNLARIHNIGVACEVTSVTLQPGEIFDANALMGPYDESKGYEATFLLIDGKNVKSYPGIAQVASTIYNAVIQLPGLEITCRVPAGKNGSSFVPVFCDAVVGDESMNLCFINRYACPIRIENHTAGDGAQLTVIWKGDSEDQHF